MWGTKKRYLDSNFIIYMVLVEGVFCLLCFKSHLALQDGIETMNIYAFQFRL